MEDEEKEVDYKEESKKLLDEITDDWILKQICIYIENMKKEG